MSHFVYNLRSRPLVHDLAARSRPDRVWSLQIRSDHRPYTLGPGGYPFPEVNLPEFLTSRRQITTVEGCTSAPAEIGAGVPQGAILRPLLFSVYLNDISSATQASNINLFADDTSAYVTAIPGFGFEGDFRGRDLSEPAPGRSRGWRGPEFDRFFSWILIDLISVRGEYLDVDL